MVPYVLAVALSALCLQVSFAAVAVNTASTTTSSTSSSITGPGVSSLGYMNAASALNNRNLVSQMYNSPFIPSNNYGVDLLSQYPNFMFCDCDLSSLIDATIFSEIGILMTKYNLRSCDLQQWERLININMPGIDAINELNMLTSLASAVQREMVRRDLVFGGYSDFCVNYLAAVDGVPTPADHVLLARREPQVATTMSSSATTTTVTNTPAPWDNSPSYYTMQYLMDRALPRLSPDLRIDIVNGVMANTPPQFYNVAHPLAQQLTSNIRGMVSDMVDLSESFLA